MAELKEWRNRIIERRMIDVGELKAHPLNPRLHPDSQANAVRGLLEEIGIVDSLIAYESEEYGGLTAIDGHLRKEIGGLWPVDILDVTDAEAELILSTFDFTTGMATLDPAAVSALLARVQLQPIENPGVLGLLAAIDGQFDEMGEAVEEEEEGGSGGIPSDGSLLELVNITVGEPTHAVARGEIWNVGRHVLICTAVLTGWAAWVPYLTGEDAIFAPYAGPFVPLTLKAEDHRLVMVQPDTYIAGHILDHYSEVYGETSIGRVE